MRRTRIICTIGPASDNVTMLQSLADAGMNIARLNFSHGDHASHLTVIERIKKLNEGSSQAVAILLDTQGPEIRTGDVKEALLLEKGETVQVYVPGEPAVEPRAVQIHYDDLITSVAVGDTITVDNGLINLQVLAKKQYSLQCRVIDGGELGSRRHVNLPGIRVNLPSITDKDRLDIQFAIENDLDFIALSFVRSGDDIQQLRNILATANSPIRIIAKIENQEGVDNIDAIIASADAIMVARGDLGVEVPIQDLPNIQRDIVKRCALAAKPVIIATHLLESMIDNPIPTRAEVTDVANAVYEEADAIMLSGETSIGKYPIKSVDYMSSIATSAEQRHGLRFTDQLQSALPRHLLAISAVRLAEQAKAKGIIVVTKYGIMAHYAASAKPQNSFIFAFTFDKRVQRQLNLQRAVKAYVLPESNDAENVVQQAISCLKQAGFAAAGDSVVVVSDFLLAGQFDSVQLRSI